MQPPNRAPINDPWPEKCSVCKQPTQNPYSVIMYSAVKEKKGQYYQATSTGYGKVEQLEFSDISEHPLRVCDTCSETKGNFKKVGVIALIAAIPFALFIGYVFRDENPIRAGLIGGLLIFASVLAFTYRSSDQTISGNQSSNLRDFRQNLYKVDSGDISIHTESQFLELSKNLIFQPRK